MAKVKERKKHGFGLAMLIYGLVLLLIVAAGLTVFWKFISEYEATRPNQTADKFIASIDESVIRDASADFVAGLNHDFQSEDEIYSIIMDYVSPGFSYVKMVSESTDDNIVYMLVCNNKDVGRFEIRSSDAGKFGFNFWEMTGAEMYFPMLRTSSEITVPPEYTVSINGHVLDSSYITVENVEYEICSQLYDNDYVELPLMVHYYADNYIGNDAMEICDEEGNPVDLSNGWNEGLFYAELTEGEKEDIESYFEDFVYFYVRFSSGAQGDHLVNYFNLRTVLLPGSFLEERMYRAIQGQNFSDSKRDTILDTCIISCMKVADNYYVCDYSYDVESVSWYEDEPTVTHNEVKILLKNDTHYGYRAATMVSVVVEVVD